MVKELLINRYRKLNNLTLSLSPNLNAITGTNGTCKTSLLHLIGNSLQAPTRNCSWIIDKNCLPIIKAVK